MVALPKHIKGLATLFRNHLLKKDWIKYLAPPVQLNDFVLAGGLFIENPKAILESLKMPPTTDSKLEQGLFYPNYYDSNKKTLKLLELLIEEFRPLTIVETGIANGKSTRKILEAIMKFNMFDSKLYSFDIDPRVETPDLKKNPQFRFILIDSANRFVESMHEIANVNLFYHDSDHSYENQMSEYTTAWEMLDHKNGILVSDDVNWSEAFLDFCKKVHRRPLLLSEGGKVCGVIRK